MNAPLYRQTASLIATTCLGHDERDRLADMWRGSASSVDDHIFYINQHSQTDSAEARFMLRWRLPRYLKALQRVSEAETRMDALGIAYARSSYDWRAN